MINVIGVRVKKGEKLNFYYSKEKTIEKGISVLVETIRGIEFGIVEISNIIEKKENIENLKKIIRIATKEDEYQYLKNKKYSKDAFKICSQKIKEHNLEMKLIDAALMFDRNKIIFYFTADGRIDFRNLVKELASIFKMRIELRQIGVRDEVKIMNGIGVCGRTLCCSTFLNDFQPVSIKMAKDQNLSLTPTKISGICGRLMCCLKYEEEIYKHINAILPNEGDIISTPDGEGIVLSVSVLREVIKAAIRSKGKDSDPKVNFYNVNEIKIISSKKKKKDIHIDPELKKILD